jgi:hypothetical protein
MGQMRVGSNRFRDGQVPMKISRATVLELRKSIRSRSRRWLLIAAGVVGLLSAGLVAFTGPAEDHTFAVISFSTQIAISLPLPFVSVLLMTQEFGRRAWSANVGLGDHWVRSSPRNSWPA